MGLLQAQSWARSTATFGRSSHERNRTARDQKESQKWPESFTACQTLAAQCPATTLVSVADREGDLYDLFVAQAAAGPAARVQLLVRAQHDRRVAHPQKSLWDFLAARRVAGRLKIQVPRKAGQPGRLATLAIRHAPVTVCAPSLKSDQPSLTLWAVEARESRPPTGATPICWRLLTTLPVASLAAAVEKNPLVCAALADRSLAQSTQERLPSGAAAIGDGRAVATGGAGGFDRRLAGAGVVPGGARGAQRTGQRLA